MKISLPLFMGVFFPSSLFFSDSSETDYVLRGLCYVVITIFPGILLTCANEKRQQVYRFAGRQEGLETGSLSTSTIHFILATSICCILPTLNQQKMRKQKLNWWRQVEICVTLLSCLSVCQYFRYKVKGIPKKYNEGYQPDFINLEHQLVASFS